MEQPNLTYAYIVYLVNVKTDPSSKNSDDYYQEIMLDYFQHETLFFGKKQSDWIPIVVEIKRTSFP